MVGKGREVGGERERERGAEGSRGSTQVLFPACSLAAAARSVSLSTLLSPPLNPAPPPYLVRMCPSMSMSMRGRGRKATTGAMVICILLPWEFPCLELCPDRVPTVVVVVTCWHNKKTRIFVHNNMSIQSTQARYGQHYPIALMFSKSCWSPCPLPKKRSSWCMPSYPVPSLWCNYNWQWHDKWLPLWNPNPCQHSGTLATVQRSY